MCVCVCVCVFGVITVVCTAAEFTFCSPFYESPDTFAAMEITFLWIRFPWQHDKNCENLCAVSHKMYDLLLLCEMPQFGVCSNWGFHTDDAASKF